MKLYFDPQIRATVAKWMLDEVGVPYDIVPTLLKDQAHKTDRLLARPAAFQPPAAQA